MTRALTYLLTSACAATLLAAPAFAGTGDTHPHRRVTISGGCNECDFAGQNLSDAMIIGAHFSDSDFSHATLINAGLQECVLSDTNLTDVNLSGARMSGVSFIDSDLRDAHLAGVQGDRVRFTGSDMERADLTGVRFVVVSFADAELGQAVLAGSQFHHADFTNASMDRTVLRGARMPRANFRDATGDRTVFVNADLRGANFTNAEFDRADFSGARLEGANLSQARLLRAQGLTHAQISAACGDTDTELPDGLVVAPCPPRAPGGNGVVMVSRNGQQVEIIDPRRMIEAQTAAIEALREVETRLPRNIEIDIRRSGDLREVRRAISEALDELQREEEREAARAERSAAEIARSEAEIAAARARLEALESLMRNHNIPQDVIMSGHSYTFEVAPENNRPDGASERFGYRWEFRSEPGEPPAAPVLPPLPPKPDEARPRTEPRVQPD